MAHLQVHDLKVRYGRTDVLRGAGFEVRSGEIVALLGANGSGKSTALNAVSGFVKPAGGSVRLDGQELAGKPTHVIFRSGIVQISQRRDLFPDLTVEENIELGLATAPRGLSWPDRAAKIYEWFPRLYGKRHMKAQLLSGGEQQMIAIARALVSAPRIILLDEPSGGLAPRVVEEIAGILSKLKDEGHTMLLVEQNIFLATAVSDRFYILRNGQVEEGDAIVKGAVTREDIVRSVYL